MLLLSPARLAEAATAAQPGARALAAAHDGWVRAFRRPCWSAVPRLRSTSTTPGASPDAGLLAPHPLHPCSPLAIDSNTHPPSVASHPPSVVSHPPACCHHACKRAPHAHTWCSWHGPTFAPLRCGRRVDCVVCSDAAVLHACTPLRFTTPTYVNGGNRAKRCGCTAVARSC